MFSCAVTRKPPTTLANGITTSKLGPPDYPLMLHQFEEYVSVLERLGLKVETLDSLSDFPDSYFVEDVAVIIPEAAMITRPGADARQGETNYIEPVLRRYRRLSRIEAPGTLEGGDVLRVENHFFIGLSDRTNQFGAEQLGNFLERYGYSWSTVKVEAGLHLKSSINYLGKGILLATPGFCTRKEFVDFQIIPVEVGDDYSANTLWINHTLITPAGFPETKDKLTLAGFEVIELGMSEAQKMDGGLTCLSLRF